MRRVIEARILTAIDARVARMLTALPRPARALVVDGWTFGLVDAEREARLARWTEVFRPVAQGLAVRPTLAMAAARTSAFDGIVRTLRDEGALTAWRNERYAVAPRFDAPPAFDIERAAARYLGIHTYAAHANGLAGDGPSARMWLARRSAAKSIDPGMLDNLVGGGIPAGEAPLATLVREAWEEAGVAAVLASAARATGVVQVERAVPDGFQRETIFTYDLRLPDDFRPASQDGEAVEHRCLDLPAVAAILAHTSGPDVMTLDATIVALACLRRHAGAAAS
jgi:8-oxo-dGTP pyrophosphatase MutT (NUDIX family)